MYYLLLAILFIAIADFVRSAVVVLKLHRQFYRSYQPGPEYYRLGKGSDFYVVLLGDSGIDGHGKNTLKFGPYQAIIEQLAKKHRVSVHCFAKEGAKSYDVIKHQLPKINALPRVDMICVYMGANNAIRGLSSARVANDFEELVVYAEKRNIIVLACEIADYWMLTMFSWIHRIIIYIRNTSSNRLIRRVAKNHANFALIAIPGATKKFNQPEYQADRLHPSDIAIREWSEIVLAGAKQNSITSKLLS